MNLLDLTLPTMAENIALDEALFRVAEADPPDGERLRIWQPPELAVVVGRGSQVAQEVELDYCDRAGIPVLRRTSGGAAIVTGPGCLMYSLILSYAERPQLQWIDVAHAFVLDRIAAQFSRIAPGVVRAGTSDLAVPEDRSQRSADVRHPCSADVRHPCGPVPAGARKFSGNSMRRGRQHLLYHGTLLFDLDVEQIPRCLKTAPRQPEYRAGREHRDFVTCLSSTEDQLRAALCAAWLPDGQTHDWPRSLVAELVEQRYGRDDWNRKR